MEQMNRYPKIGLRSKNEIAKRTSYSKVCYTDALALVNEVLAGQDLFWKDSKASEPERCKYVRTAKGTRLGKLLKLIDERILATHDELLPAFLFGGIRGRDHIKAGKSLLGQYRHRTLLRLDVVSFFEQVSEKRVIQFFQKKCSCSFRAAKILAQVCCVPLGPKDSNSKGTKVLARGFATSPRLAVWCNLDAFIRLERLVKKHLKGHDPRIAVYVDDIGIMASRVPKAKLEKLYNEIRKMLLTADPNQRLDVHPLNSKKSQIVSHQDSPEFLGLRLLRNRMTIGRKTNSSLSRTKASLQKATSAPEKKRLSKIKSSLLAYKRSVES